MNPSVLYMFHNTSNKRVLSITNRININLDRIIYELIDQDRMTLRNILCLLDKFL